jgi:hypothetical protein
MDASSLVVFKHLHYGTSMPSGGVHPITHIPTLPFHFDHAESGQSALWKK